MSELPKSRRRRVRRRVITDGAPERACLAKTYHRPRRCGMHRHATNLMSSGPQPRHWKASFPPTGSAAQGDRSSTKLPSRHQEPDSITLAALSKPRRTRAIRRGAIDTVAKSADDAWVYPVSPVERETRPTAGRDGLTGARFRPSSPIRCGLSYFA